MKSEVVKLCSDLIAIPSVNPQSQQEFDINIYGEHRIADFLAGWFESRVFQADVVKVAPYRSNVVARIPGRDRSRCFLFCGHLDTVDVEGMNTPFDPTIWQNRIYGRGACDDKGPLAATCVAAIEAAWSDNLPCDIIILASCGEEYNMLGALDFARKEGKQITGAIFIEPTDFNIIYAHKGVARLNVLVPGLSAHSSMPDKGDNAIYNAADAIAAIREFADAKKISASHPLLGTETIAPTIIKGGQQINVIPDLCQIKIDWRTLPGISPQQCALELQNYLRTKLQKETFVSVMESVASAMESDPNSEMIKKLSSVAADTAGGGKTKVANYATDASAFSDLGIPLAVFGPGSIAQAHCIEEYIDIDKLQTGTEILKQFMLNL